MASSSWRSSSSSSPPDGPRAKCDQVVYEAIAKAAEIIVQARSDALPNSTSSSRFNLHVAEIESVRSILQQWRRSLHVPLRLDVYYQHANEKRELLERWCLQYEPGASTHFASECVCTDPLVQLRHVCKKIVVWLRSLYTMARMLPAHRLLLARQKLHFSMDIEGVWQDLPQFRQEGLLPVPTPYGPLQWRVWYAPNVNRLLGTRKTVSRPIPMVKAQRNDYIAVPDQAQSAPAHDIMAHAATLRPRSHHHQISRKPMARSHSLVGEEEREAILQRQQQPETIRPVVQRCNSMNPNDSSSSSQQRSGLSLAMENSTRRTALHHPPPTPQQGDTYGYGYNHLPPTVRVLTPTTPTSLVGAAMSSSPMGLTPPLSSTPPVFAGSHAPGPLIPPRSTMQTPPFAGLPTALSDPQLAPPQSPHSTSQQRAQQEYSRVDESSILPPITSLDLLHSSPFKGGSILSSLMSESEALKHSSMKHGSSMLVPSLSHYNEDDNDEDAQDDMPFAVQDGVMEESAVASLAHKCATASRLQLFESQSVVAPTATGNKNDTDDMASSLADQLAEFRTFGASLHISTPPSSSSHVGHSRRGSDASAHKASSSGGNEGSTSTLISTRS